MAVFVVILSITDNNVYLHNGTNGPNFSFARNGGFLLKIYHGNLTYFKCFRECFNSIIIDQTMSENMFHNTYDIFALYQY